MRAIRISQISIGAVVLFASPIILAQSDKAKGAREDDLSMPLNPHARGPVNSISIHQEIDFNASPEQLYDALLDPNQFTTFSGRPAEIDRKIGGAFSLFGGHIIGRNVELIPNERIVQAWRVVTWPEGVYSIARFEIKPQGTGARVLLDHVGFPEGLHDHLAEGWESNYWSLLKKYFH